MDSVKAEELRRNLQGREIAGWIIEAYINHGKSAAVFKARRDNKIAAVKIFDDELLKRYGDAAQFARIERELSLIGADHPNMVRILGGGVDDYTKNHYIIMEFIDGPNLAECLSEVPFENIPTLIEQLASVGHFLEGRQLCHRDIKPANIAITEDFSHLVLLDFGVVRPVGVSELTDGEQFVGTSRYSSPEFLLRKEEDTVEGWRALTIYQIGGVLHDLIMRKPLFSEFSEPHAVLINAVQREQPIIQSSTVPRRFIDLAGRCLLKDWKIRVNLVDWKDFAQTTEPAAALSSAKERVTNRGAFIRAQQAQRAQAIGASTSVPRESDVLAEALDALKSNIRSIRSENTIFPPVEIYAMPPGSNRLRVKFESSTDLGLPQALIIFIEVTVLEAVSNAVEVTVRAHLGTEERATENLKPERLYAGICNGAGIREALENYLYNLMDLALQDYGADTLGKFEAPVTEESHGSNLVDNTGAT